MYASLYQLYNARIPSIASSDDSQTTKDLETLFNNVADGKTIKVVGSNAMLDGVKTKACEYCDYSDVCMYKGDHQQIMKMNSDEVFMFMHDALEKEKES